VLWQRDANGTYQLVEQVYPEANGQVGGCCRVTSTGKIAIGCHTEYGDWASNYALPEGGYTYGGVVRQYESSVQLTPGSVAHHLGGQRVTLTAAGSLPADTDLTAYLGPTGDNTDAPCYSGVPGQGYVVKPEDGETFKIVTPPAAIGENIISFREVGGSIDNSTGTIDVVSEPHRDKAHRLRSSLQPWQSTGQRRIGDW
jgi:hypothetical protein